MVISLSFSMRWLSNGNSLALATLTDSITRVRCRDIENSVHDGESRRIKLLSDSGSIRIIRTVGTLHGRVLTPRSEIRAMAL
jgi:hypothetical protein